MRNLNELNGYRVRTEEARRFFAGYGDHEAGLFIVAYPRTGVALKVIASTERGWDHVSVSLPNRCPNWLEMEHIKRMFFREEETAMQIHVPPAEHISLHPFCLHLWRPLNCDIPRPPNDLVGG